MANVKITGLPALTTPATADLLEIVDDVAGTPTSKKITIADLLKSPGPIGGTAPGTGAFTTLTASSFINGAYATVASHATTSAIWAAAGNVINFTGTETITDFPAAAQAGSQRFLICAGAVIFTHAGNITVQGAATYTASAGDVVLVTAITTTTFKINILPQDGKAIIPVVQQNLLTNSGFEIWSNSTLVEATSGAAPVLDGANAALVNNLLTNGGFDSATTGWTATGTSTSDGTGKTGNGLKNENNGVQYASTYQTVTTVIGKLYSFSAWFQKGTADSGRIKVGITGVSSEEIYSSASLADGAFAQYNFIFEATGTSTTVTLQNNSNTSGHTSYFDSVTLYEVTPGCIAADTLGPDGWSKDSTLDVYREHSGSNTKDGAFYALRMVPSAASDYLIWNFNQRNNEPNLSEINGRTFTAGAWIKTSTATHARLHYYDSIAGDSYSGYHTGGGGWEWIEYSFTINSASTSTYLFGVRTTQSSGDVYISQPMLIFGSHIGEGNYSRPNGEVVWFEQDVESANFNGSLALSSVSATINIEADTNGKIGKGVKAFYIWAAMRDSASAAGGTYFRAGATTSFPTRFYFDCGGLANDVYSRNNGVAAATSSGDLYTELVASGANTFDITAFKFTGIQLR